MISPLTPSFSQSFSGLPSPQSATNDLQVAPPPIRLLRSKFAPNMQPDPLPPTRRLVVDVATSSELRRSSSLHFRPIQRTVRPRPYTFMGSPLTGQPPEKVAVTVVVIGDSVAHKSAAFRWSAQAHTGGALRKVHTNRCLTKALKFYVLIALNADFTLE